MCQLEVDAVEAGLRLVAKGVQAIKLRAKVGATDGEDRIEWHRQQVLLAHMGQPRLLLGRRHRQAPPQQRCPYEAQRGPAQAYGLS